MKNKKYIDNDLNHSQDPDWAGFLLDDRIVDISLHRPGGLATLGGKFPCPGEAPSTRGVPPLHELLASPGAPRSDDWERLESLRLQIETGTYLNEDVIDRVADKFLKAKVTMTDDDT